MVASETITIAELLAILRLRLNAARATLHECNIDERSQVSFSSGQVAAYEELIERFSR